MPGWREDKDQDIADAIALMNAAGVGVGADETITIPTPIQCPCHATGIKEDVSVLGLDLELQQATGADYFAERSQGNFIMNIGLEVGGTDADTYLYHRFQAAAARAAAKPHARNAGRNRNDGQPDASMAPSSRFGCPLIITRKLRESELRFRGCRLAWGSGRARLAEAHP